jgi:menaquinone-9 beta-reductase
MTVTHPDEPRQVDVLIIGSGPAGLSTALHLVQRDPAWRARLVILEKDHHPRHKLCGGALTYTGLRILQRLAIELPLPIPQSRVNDLRLLYDGRVLHVRGDPVFIVFRRAEFDACLAGIARERGIRIQEGETVNAIERNAAGLLVTTNRARYLARTVVGADGSKGRAKRFVYGGSAPTRVGRTLEVVASAEEQAPLFTEQAALFDFNPVHADLQGYFWDFPSRLAGEPFYNRGVYDARYYRQKPRADLPEILAEALTGLDPDNHQPQPESHPIHWFSLRNRFSAPHLLLVGDAAGADPLLGEGIAPALGHGEVAARAIQQAFNRQEFSYRGYKRQLLTSPIGRYLLVRTYIAWWSFRLCHLRWFMHTLWSVAMLVARLLPRPGINLEGQPAQENHQT